MKKSIHLLESCVKQLENCLQPVKCHFNSPEKSVGDVDWTWN